MKTSCDLPRAVHRLLLAGLALALLPATAAFAADHGDGPMAALDAPADLADGYFFLDPNDATKAVLITTMRGFIVPSEAGNFGIFDPGVRHRFEIENTGDAKPDKFIDVTFSPRVATNAAQTATIAISGQGQRIIATALATNPSLGAASPTPVVTDIGNGISFFAGETDDPFFFDIPGFNRFVSSVLANAVDPTRLDRGRDSFAGYNVIAIALRVPVTLIKGTGNTVGLDVLTQRRVVKEIFNRGNVRREDGDYRNVDREGNPAVNVALVPFAMKNAYNAGDTQDDAKGKFAAGIVGTLTALGTNSANIGVLASVAVNKGDFLHLDVSLVNQGLGGGNNAGVGFPNGRRLRDDVIDTELFIITNGVITAGDHANANDLPFRDTFPFLSPSQQPREGAGNVEDNTRN